MGNRTQTTVILGCGWLGQIVGEAQVQKGITVYGSYRRPEVDKKLTEKGIQGFELDFNKDLNVPSEICAKATHVFIFITPSSAKERSYPELLTCLMDQFPSGVKVIFSSSSGVYPKAAGTYNEKYKLDPSIPNRLLPAELALQKLLNKRLIILRLAGLIGPERHPAYSLSGKTLKDDGSNPVNLIHAKDIVAAIEWLCENAYFGHTYNLASPKHPSKKEYYTTAANHFGVSPPEFGEERATNRLVEGNLIEQETSFRYNHALDNFDDFLR
jgi:nucleoside-diphosphate-sugar epimerase